MLRLRVHVPGRTEPHVATLAPGSALLIGRAPDAARVASTHDLSAWRVVPLAIDSEKVSAQHALVGRGPDGAWVIDLGSRNGTSLRLRPHAPESLAHGEAVLDLAAQSPDAAPEQPRAPGWVGADDFAERVTAALGAWFDELGVPMRLALATGHALTVTVPRDVTADTRLPALLDAVAYVDEQNALLDQERGHGDDLVIRSAAGHRRWDHGAAVRRAVPGALQRALSRAPRRVIDRESWSRRQSGGTRSITRRAMTWRSTNSSGSSRSFCAR